MYTNWHQKYVWMFGNYINIEHYYKTLPKQSHPYEILCLSTTIYTCWYISFVVKACCIFVKTCWIFVVLLAKCSWKFVKVRNNMVNCSWFLLWKIKKYKDLVKRSWNGQAWPEQKMRQKHVCTSSQSNIHWRNFHRIPRNGNPTPRTWKTCKRVLIFWNLLLAQCNAAG